MTSKISPLPLALFCGAAAAIGSLGCVTVRTAESRGGEQVKTEHVLPVPSSRLGKGPGAILIVAELKAFEGGEQDFECRWRMIHQETNKSYFLTLKAGKSEVFSQMEPGTYKTGRLGCGVAKVWGIDDVFKEGFRVEDGSVSYLGKLTFEFKNTELETIRKSSRTESARAFAAAVNATPAIAMPVISGFTGRRIEPAMVEGGEALREGFDVYAKGVTDFKTQLDPLVSALQVCAKDDSTRDPLRFGRLEYIAVYKDGRFNEMKSRRETNGFSDRLRSCVERGMMAFHPGAKSELEVRVRY